MCLVLISKTFFLKLEKLKTIEWESIPLLSPPLTGLINKGNEIGIDDSCWCWSGSVTKKSAVLIFAFKTSFFAKFLSLSLSNAVLLDAIYGIS